MEEVRVGGGGESGWEYLRKSTCDDALSVQFVTTLYSDHS